MSDSTRRAFLASAAALAVPALASDAFSTGRTMTQPDFQAVADRAAVIDVVDRIASAADYGEWEACRACFADEVRADYTSLTGGEPGTVRADDLIAGWRGVLPGFDATHHSLTNHDVRVDGDRATARSHFAARHVLGGERWTLGGHYEHALVRTDDGWKVTAMTMRWTWEEGDRALAQRAAARVSGQR